MQTITRIGLDIAESVFQVFGTHTTSPNVIWPRGSSPIDQIITAFAKRVSPHS
jgi:hypothetical protein